jgi:membrane fusion protein, copper/silver efflux system
MKFRLLIFVLFAITGSSVGSCKHETKKEAASEKNDVYYTCSMHPQIKEEHPGKCPICQMELIPVPKGSLRATGELNLNEEQIRLGNIQVDTIRTGNIGDRLTLAGTLNFDQQKRSSINTRVPGRIERLLVKKTGDYIHKGEAIYEMYSEQLNNAKQEYVNALQQQTTIGNSLINYGAIVESAKGKLILWGMSNEQIALLARSNQLSANTTFYSAENGYVTAFNIQEGGYAMEGSPVMQLADLSTLWAEAQVYTTELSSLDEGSNVSVQIPDLGNQLISGKINFENPEINPDTRINLVRITIQNPNNRLHPGMPVYIIASSRQHHSIVLPADAVLSDSKGSIVWVQTKPGAYAVRMVKLGIANDLTVEIKSGLQPGDIVVTSGAYLINSEYILEHGSSPMEGMDMNKM